MAGATLVGVRSAQASTVTATITGTVAYGTDYSGVFGFAPGTDLTGMSFTLVFTFDDTKGQEFFYPTYSLIENTASSNPGTAALTIGGGSFAFGVQPHAGSSPSSEAKRTGPGGYGEFYFEAGDGFYGAGSGITVQIYPLNPNVVTDTDWEDAFSDSSLAPSTASFEITEGGDLGDASGGLTPTSIVVSGPLGTNPEAKTFGNNGNNGCGCQGSNPVVENTGMSQVAEPIEVGNGNMFYQVTDYTTAGPNPLQFIRYYNSMGNVTGVNTYASSLGTNWRSNYDRYLHIGGSTVTAERPDGQVLTFTLNGSKWQSDSDVDVTLTNAGSTWTLTDHNDTVETYNTVSGEFYDLLVTYGQLTSIRARNGYTQTLSYSGGVSTVTDSYGLTLKFTYANGLLQTLTTPDTPVLTYAFTAATGGNQLTSVSYNTNPVTSQTYFYGNTAFPFAMTGITDENGNRYATWAYDLAGRATSSQLGSGANLTSLTYGSNGTTTVTNALGVADTYTFQALQGVPKITQISRAATGTTAAGTETFGYDGNGYLNGKTDWNGNRTTYVNNVHGQPTTVNEAVGSAVARTTTISYDATWLHEPHQIVTPGLTSTFTYDGSGNPLTRTDLDTTTNTVPYSTNGQTRVTKWTWSSTGEEQSVQLPRTDVPAKTSFGYNSNGALNSIKDALGHETQITSLTGGGLPLTIIDPNNVTATLTYDARLNLHTGTLTTTAGKLVTTWTHDAANNLTAIQWPDNSKLTYGYDTAHRLTGINDLLGNSIAYTLDALGDRTLIQTKNASAIVTRKHSATFDALGRVLHDIGGVGQTTAYTYDPNGNVLTVAPPSPSGAITYTYDALNRLATAKDPSPGGTTTASYDAHNRVLNVKDANGNTTDYVYDGFGDRTQTASPDSGTAIYHYDADRNLTAIVKPGPLTANITYDALDRPLATTYPSDATLKVSRTYDQTVHAFGIGRLTSVTDQAGSLNLTYDERGNVTAENRVVTGAGSLLTVTAYDAVSRVSAIAYPSGTFVAYGRDSMGRVISIKARPPGASAGSNIATGIAYEPFGPETALTFGNGIAGAYGYDLDYRPTTRTDASTTAVQKLTYAYYANNSVETITDGVNSANTQALGYDALDRLTSAKSGTGGYGTFAYTWDPVSNIETQVVNGTTTTYTPVTGSNRLSKWVTGATTETVASTAAGNINTLTVGTTALDTLIYNQANELATAKTTSTSATYEYDLSGQRLEKALPGSYPILYQYGITDGGLLSENDLHKGQTADYIYLNGRPIGEVNPATGKLYFTHTDRLGTPQKLTDSTQAVAWSALYQPFGSTGITATGTLTTQSLRFPGQEFDAETGLYHNGFRDYAPGLTRYVESDPIGLAGGMNTYLYVGNNPLIYVDPFGLDKTYWFNPSGWLYGPINGNWGGKCWSGGQQSCSDGIGNAPPTDSGDLCYMHHDLCYDACDKSCPANGDTSAQCAQSCDAQLEQCLNNLSDDPKKWPMPPLAGTEKDSASYRNMARDYFR